jgi:pentatricopeptide repeat protein
MARRVFEEMLEWDTVAWNLMLAGCLRHGLSMHAMEFWRRMLGEGHMPDSVALSMMLLLFSDDNGEQMLEIHAWMTRHGTKLELSVANALIQMYPRKNELSHALWVFESMTVRDLVSWNAII